MEFEKGKLWVTRGRKATDPDLNRDGGAAEEIAMCHLAYPLVLREGFFFGLGRGDCKQKDNYNGACSVQ